MLCARHGRTPRDSFEAQLAGRAKPVVTRFMDEAGTTIPKDMSGLTCEEAKELDRAAP